MAALKYSRQREVIKEYLSNTDDHPTADTVYMHVRQAFPRISLGTVYRNLNLLADMGEANKITTPDGAVRFDGITYPHYHVLCTECGRLFDLDMEVQDSITEQAKACFSGTINSHSAMFYGVCSHCRKQKQ
ncbi:MAG: transcriptional repressor [Eubacteriales bacterium]|nr:transcriptional repressor [Eubacteriales bacterium]